MSNPNHVEKVSSIIKVLNGGIEFYSDATEKVESQSIKTVFQQMINDKQAAITTLQPFAVAENGDYEDDSAVAVDIRNMYTKVISSLTSNSDHTFVSQLEEVEDKILAELREALKEDQPAACTMALNKVLTDMKRNHDQMRALQKSTA
ncbi:conserved hypothetical protein [Paraglaciecola sp. T6c]|uniref:ferritin-like domain-containing protein n=1 Tax=Pseudoalteromonas atlantica (strain T6c / ATCC BAA-1087) TaxID=3042615 RepID=UPI00005C5427|nr:PA2169 family four-helix-bundle protein [Paraglaciecola sp. T6c]ABG42590.1 conserved hypothetical protein [Paraglaciecola sp. T6c]